MAAVDLATCQTLGRCVMCCVINAKLFAKQIAVLGGNEMCEIISIQNES